jgi:mannitol-1-/sugar-/sorbitol-6-phosphatase
MESLDYSTLPDASQARPVPGAIQLLRQLHSLRVLAVVTSGTRDYAHGKLAGQRALDLLAIVVTGDDVSGTSRTRRTTSRACAALGVEPGRSVVFEDAPAGVAARRQRAHTAWEWPVRAPPMASPVRTCLSMTSPPSLAAAHHA